MCVVRYTNLLSFTVSAAFADSPLDASFAFELAVYCSNCPRLGQLELVTAYLCPVDMLMMCLLQLKVPFTTRFYLYPGTQCPLLGRPASAATASTAVAGAALASINFYEPWCGRRSSRRCPSQLISMFYGPYCGPFSPALALTLTDSHSSCNSRFILHASKLVFNLPHSATFYAILIGGGRAKISRGRALCYMLYYDCVNSFNGQCNDLIDMYLVLDKCLLRICLICLMFK